MMKRVRRQAILGGATTSAYDSDAAGGAASAIARARGHVELETEAEAEAEAAGASAGASSTKPYETEVALETTAATPLADGGVASADLRFSTHDMAALPPLAVFPGPREPLPLTAEKTFQLTEHIRAVKPVPARVIVALLGAAKEIVDQEPNVVRVQLKKGDRLTVVGDTHGHINSLYFILANNGTPGPGNHYLFNGDFVDRADFGSEIVATVIAFKILFPQWVHINRGK